MKQAGVDYVVECLKLRDEGPINYYSAESFHHLISWEKKESSNTVSETSFFIIYLATDLPVKDGKYTGETYEG